MTRSETAQLIALMQANYPDEFRTMSDEALHARVNLWAAMFRDDDAEQVKMAVIAHMASDTSRFMPPVGAIKNKLVSMRQGETMTELEAWGCVMNALRNSAYNSSAEFAKLTPTIQRAVGSAAQLRDWNKQNSESLSVTSSNFQRTYTALVKREREYQALPSSVRGYISQITAGMDMGKQLEDKPQAPQLEAPQEPEDEKTQSVVLMLNRYRDRMTPEQYDALYEQAMHGGTSAVLQELLAMLDAPIPTAAMKLRPKEA